MFKFRFHESNFWIDVAPPLQITITEIVSSGRTFGLTGGSTDGQEGRLAKGCRCKRKVGQTG